MPETPIRTRVYTTANRLGCEVVDEGGYPFTAYVKAPYDKQFKSNGRPVVDVLNYERAEGWRTLLTHLERGLTDLVVLDCGCPQWMVDDDGHQEGCGYTHPADRWRTT